MSSFSSYRIFKMKYKIILFCSLFLFFSNTDAQETGEDKLGSWYMYSGSHKISNKISLKSAVQIRTYEPVSNFNILFLSAGASYSINKNLSAGFNYAYQNWDKSFESNDVPNTNEHRFIEQISLKSLVGKTSLSNRLRLENRFIDNNSSEETQHRLRYRFQAKFPLCKNLFLSFYDELFYNLEGFKFQQNRLYGALGIKAAENYSFQLGYMKHSFKTKAFDRLQIGIAIKTDWSKKNKNKS